MSAFEVMEQLPALGAGGRTLDLLRRHEGRAYFVADRSTGTPLGGPFTQLHVARAWADGFRHGEHEAPTKARKARPR